MHSGWVFALAVSPDGRFVYSGSGDKTLKQCFTGHVKQCDASSGAVRTVAWRCGSV